MCLPPYRFWSDAGRSWELAGHRGVEILQEVPIASFLFFFFPFYSYHRLSDKIFANKLSSDSKPLLIFAPFQGWVFNVVPWLVAIPTSLFSGFLSDHLINQGKSSFGFSSALVLCDGEGGPGWEEVGLLVGRRPSK